MTTTTERDTLRSRIELVRTCVRDEAEYIREEAHPEDRLHKIVDGCVPGDLEAGLDGGVWKLLQAAIYERLYEAADIEARSLGLFD